MLMLTVKRFLYKITADVKWQADTDISQIP